MPRFFVDPCDIDTHEKTVLIHGDNARHLTLVLRVQINDEVTVCDGSGFDYLCKISAITKNEISAEIIKTIPSYGEEKFSVSLYVALGKNDKVEHIIRKAVELGANEITPFISERCVSRPAESDCPKKLERYRKIAEEAAKQCGRGKIPVIRDVVNFKSALKLASAADIPLFLFEGETNLSIKSALAGKTPQSISIITGPEGGFSFEEVALAQNSGMECVSIGRRILRCETAPLAALCCVMYEYNGFAI